MFIPFVSIAQNDHRELLPNGSVKEEGKLVDSLKQGLWKSFYDNGKPFCEGKYKDDKKTGRWKCYYRSGQLLSDQETESGKNLSYYADGKIEFEGQLKGSAKHGLWEYFYKDGKSSRKVNYKQGLQQGKERAMARKRQAQYDWCF